MSTPATYIRDQIYNRLITSAFSWKSTRRVPIPTLTIDSLPSLSVFLLRENMIPDGDSNVLEPRYQSDVVVSIVVTDLASKPDVLEGSVDRLVDQIEDTLLCDPSFVSLKNDVGVAFLDSIPNVSRAYSFPNNGETYFLECRLQLTLRFFCHFQPTIGAAFETLSVDVRPFDDTVEVAAPFIITLPQV